MATRMPSILQRPFSSFVQASLGPIFTCTRMAAPSALCGGGCWCRQPTCCWAWCWQRSAPATQPVAASTSGHTASQVSQTPPVWLACKGSRPVSNTTSSSWRESCQSARRPCCKSLDRPAVMLPLSLAAHRSAHPQPGSLAEWLFQPAWPGWLHSRSRLHLSRCVCVCLCVSVCMLWVPGMISYH